MEEVGKRHVIHHQMALLLPHFEEERMVGDDVPVVQVFYIRKISLQEEDVLPV